MPVELVSDAHSGFYPYLVQVMKDPDVSTVIRERYSFPDLWILVMDVVNLGGNPNADCGQGQLQNDNKKGRALQPSHPLTRMWPHQV